MNTSSSSDFEDLLCCPICQVPSNKLKILFSVHVSICDVSWNDLKECEDGIDCQNDSIFHYRDFSHRILATHRENMASKRKHESVEIDTEKSSRKSVQKKNLNMKRICKQRGTDDEDDIFVSKTKKQISLVNENVSNKGTVKTKKTNKSINKKIQINSNDNKDEEKCLITSDYCTNDTTINSDGEINTVQIQNVVDSVDVKNNFSGQLNVTCSLQSNKEFDDSITDISQNFDNECSNLENIEGNNVNIKKEKCKAKWNDIFKKSMKEKTSRSNIEKQLTTGKSTIKKTPKVCPYFKKMPGTGFAVDAFQYGDIPGITTYFLSHFHADHYIGLKKAFSHPIYCSLITANLVKKKLRVQENYLRILELKQPVIINRVEVTTFDANHCPGSIIILFRLLNGEQYLHVGDFRASTSMEEEPELQNVQISRLYLDTTYFDPEYIFPSQIEVINRVKEIVREGVSKYPKVLFVSGSYLIGKEKVFIGILEELNCKLWAQPPKRDVFRCINDDFILSSLTEDPVEAKVHVLPMNHLRMDRLKKHLLDLSGAFSHIYAFKPTGWEMGRTSSTDWVNVSSNGNISIFGVPYSEHSNFQEICRFIKFVKADKVIPTVHIRNREMYGYLKSLVDSYKGGSKQPSIEQYITSK